MLEPKLLPSGAAAPANGQAQTLRFGPFQLLRARRLLLDGEAPVRMGARQMDLLLALIDRQGEVIGNEELMSLAWPDSAIEESSLRAHIATLRKALGESPVVASYVANVPGRGYSFVAPVHAVEDGAASLAGHAMHNLHHLPDGLTRMIGRQQALDMLSVQLGKHRLVTITGPGGVGKTTLAMALARPLAPGFAHGVWFVDLAVLTDPQRVPGAVAAAFGLALDTAGATAGLGTHLAPRQALIVMDNCEHVIDAAATLVVALLSAAPGLRILTTSREPLRVEGECVHRLASLAYPTGAETLTTAQALQYPAIQLLAERVAANVQDFELADRDAGSAAQLCRRLDGNPLAIELAAGRVNPLGLQTLVAELDANLKLLDGGALATQPRHQTLWALLDWSYRLLSVEGRAVLRRLSAFAGSFTLDAAVKVVGDETLSPDLALEQIGDLVSKSLLARALKGDEMRYRLLDTTRGFANDRLGQGEEKAHVSRRHALHVLAQLEQTAGDWQAAQQALWMRRHGALLDEVRLALDWAASEHGDAVLCAQLTVACGLLTHRLSLLEEFRARIERALDRLARLAPQRPDLELQLQAALSALRAQTAGALPDDEAAQRRALDAARAAGMDQQEADILSGLWVGSFGRGDYDVAHALVERAQALARRNEDDSAGLNADRMMAQTLHCLGRHREAWDLAGRVLDDPTQFPRLRPGSSVPFDRRVSMGITRARILWMQGRSDQAMALVRQTLSHAQNDVAFAQCHVLAFAACPVALWCGDTDAAIQWTQQLAHVAEQHGLRHWATWAANYAHLIAGDAPPAIPDGDVKQWDLMPTLSPKVAINPRTWSRVENGTLGWCAPEILRRRAEQLLRGAEPPAGDAAGALLRRAIAMAGAQSALAWELRAAASLARLLARDRGAPEAFALLSGVLARIDEGQGTPDVRTARQLLQQLR